MPTRRVIRRCPFCGARISADDAQCPICGQQLRLSPAAHGSTQENVAGQNAAYPEPQLQLPPPRTLSIARQHALQHPPPTAPARRVRQARRITIRVDDPNNYVGPFEVTYLQCPNCGGRANITDAFCGVCGYPLRANTPMQPQPKPIAVWSPRLQRPIPPAHFEVPLDAPDDYNSVNRPKH